MDYQETIEFLYQQIPMFQQVGASAYKDNLDNTIALDAMFGACHNRYKTIHVAGTNGKGSVSHMLAAILQSAGYKVGLYTSPHLKDFRERIKVNGCMVPENAVVDFVGEYLEKNKEYQLEPSFFELTVAMAFHHFANAKVDVAVVEVGLGGRLDSTNIITPELSIITNISYDHTNILGNTLPKIATEKAGIIKPGIPLVVGETNEETKPVFQNRSDELGAKITFAEEEYFVNGSAEAGYYVTNACCVYLKEIVSGLKGNYQQKNLATVIASVAELRKIGYKLTDKDILTGLKSVVEMTGLLGRWQTLKEKPLVICDTGHNEAGIKYLVEQIAKTPHQNLLMVIGVVNDKDVSKMLSLLPVEATYFFTRAKVERAMDAKDLQNHAVEFGLMGEAYPTVEIAYQAALSMANENDMVFIGGSTFVVAEVL